MTTKNNPARRAFLFTETLFRILTTYEQKRDTSMYTTNGQQSTEDGLRHHVVLDEQALHNLDIVNARLGVGRSTNPNTGDNLHRLAEHALQFAPASAAQGRTQDT